MKSQVHNQGSLKELTVTIEEDVVEAIERMSSVTGMTMDELVVIALKRFRASHCDFEGSTPEPD